MYIRTCICHGLTAHAQMWFRPLFCPHRVRLILPHFRCSASSLVPSDSAPLALSSVTVGGASRSAEESVAEEEATMARKVDPRLTFSEQYRLAEDLGK